MADKPHPLTPHIYAGTELFRTTGYTLDVIIRREPGAVEEEGVPNFIETRGLIDTGASDTCIDYKIAHALKLIEVDQTTAIGFGGAVPASVYLADIEMPQIQFRGLMYVLSARVHRGGNYGMLIGRSILKDYIANFDGPSGAFTIYRAGAALPGPVEDE